MLFSKSFAFKFAIPTAFFLTSVATGISQDFWENAEIADLRADRGQWERVYTYSSGALRAVAFGDGVTVAVGDSAGILTSENLVDWTRFSSESVWSGLSAVLYADGLWVAVGDDRLILTSEDGYTWTGRNYAGTGGFSGLAHSAEHGFVAVGDTIYQSPAGLEWSEVEESGGLDAVAYGNGRYVALYSTGALAVSENGLDWEVPFENDLDTDVATIVFGAGRFWAGGPGGLAWSLDGGEWTRANELENAPIDTMAMVGDLLVGSRGEAELRLNDEHGWVDVSENVAVRFDLADAAATEDGIIAVSKGWESSIMRATGFSPPTLNAVAVGDERTVAGGFRGRLFYTDAGDVWQETRSPLVQNVRGIGHGAAGFVAAGGHGALARSANGITWERGDSTVETNLNAIAYGSGRYVAVGDGGTSVSSLDAVEWTSGSVGVGANLQAVAYGDGEFVAAGFQGTIARSSDGNSWTLESHGSEKTLNAIAYGGGRFVAGGPGGRILVSAGEGRWLVREIEELPDLRALVYANERFVAAGHDGRILVSPDGFSWTEMARDDLTAIKALAFDGTRFYAIGNRLLEGKVRSGSRLPIVWAEELEVAVGEEAVLSASHEPAPGTEIQWYKDGRLLEGETGETLVVPGAGMDDTGLYSYRLPWLDREVESAPFVLAVTGGYADWQADESSSPVSDPGDFGIPNLLRYGFDLDPDLPERDRLPRMERRQVYSADGLEDYLALRFRLQPGATDLSWNIEYAYDLAAWTPLPADETLVMAEGAETLVLFPEPAEPAAFWRVRLALDE